MSIPTFYSPKESIIDYFVTCVKDGTRKEVEEIYEHYMDRNVLIIKYLNDLRKINKQRKDTYRERAYSTAIKELSRLNVPIINVKQISSIRGIGKSIQSKVDEIIKYGKLDIIDIELSNEMERMRVIETLIAVHGIGPSKAKELYAKGYRTPSDIPLHELNKAQRIGIKYYEDFQLKIPRDEVVYIEPQLREVFNSMTQERERMFEICGSYRRGKELLGDIDILISSDIRGVLKLYIEELHKKGLLEDDISLGAKKYMGVTLIKNHGRRIDIRLIPKEEWGSGVLYFTGSKDFNIHMRNRAIEMGLTLNEYGLFTQSKRRIPTPTEESVFDVLQMEYVQPKDRT